MRDFLGSDLDPLDERLQVVAPEATVLGSYPQTCFTREARERFRCDLSGPLSGSAFRPVRIGTSCIPNALQLRDSSLEIRIAQFGHAVLDRLIEPCELTFGVGRLFSQLGNSPFLALRLILPTLDQA